MRDDHIAARGDYSGTASSTGSLRHAVSTVGQYNDSFGDVSFGDRKNGTGDYAHHALSAGGPNGAPLERALPKNNGIDLHLMSEISDVLYVGFIKLPTVTPIHEPLPGSHLH